MTLVTWSFSKKHNSTAQPSGSGRTYDVKLKENTSIENPVFIIGTGIDADISYAQAFGNYYFIDDIVMLTNNLVELHCSIDVLATHKTAIGNYTAFVERAASNYNTMIKDSAISQSQKVVSERKETTSIFDNYISSDGVYVIGVIGAYGSSTGGISVYVLTKTELETALDFMFTESNFTDVLTDSIVKSFFNPFQYIVFLRWYPLTKQAFTLTYVPIKFGWWNTGNATYGKLSDITLTRVKTLTMPTGYYTDFRGYDSEYTQCFIEIPTVGTVPFDLSQMSKSGDSLIMSFYLDIATGDTVVKLDVSNVSTTSHVGSYSGQMGASIPVGQVNGEMGSLISSAAQIGAAIIGEAPEMAAGGIKGVVGSYNPSPSMLGTYGSRAYYAGMVNAWISIRVYESGDIPAAVYGRMCCKNLQISTLSGFIKCSEASIALAAPDTEIDKVNAYLNGGFYYE